jgi:hypothetical protein
MFIVFTYNAAEIGLTSSQLPPIDSEDRTKSLRSGSNLPSQITEGRLGKNIPIGDPFQRIMIPRQVSNLLVLFAATSTTEYMCGEHTVMMRVISMLPSICCTEVFATYSIRYVITFGVASQSCLQGGLLRNIG